MTKGEVLASVQRSFRRLVDEDGHLFDCPIENAAYQARKLHEVCINHRLANHLEKEMIPALGFEVIFVDIEFNREGGKPKNVVVDGEDETLRPDIIIHNRKTGSDKLNFLVAECKKDPSAADIERDRQKLLAFMTDARYEYAFGLQVLYKGDGVTGTLFFKTGSNISEEDVDTGGGRAN